MSLRFAAAAVIVLAALVTKANVVEDTLYINRGLFTAVNGQTFPFLAYNATPDFSAQTPVFQLHTNDTLALTVVNTDTVVHGIAFDALSLQLVLPPGAAGTLSMRFDARGVYAFYDPTASANRYMGLSGMIAVDNGNAKKYFWLLRDHQKQYNAAIENGTTVDWNAYKPDYFTVNGWSFPELQNDTTARVVESLGDTVHIFVLNGGQSAHAIHFHGFHCKVLQSISGTQEGRVKDTFPFRSMEGMLLEMVPDKEGEYSVHDHNLVAISGGGTHPNGMFLIMKILP